MLVEVRRQSWGLSTPDGVDSYPTTGAIWNASERRWEMELVNLHELLLLGDLARGGKPAAVKVLPTRHDACGVWALIEVLDAEEMKR